MRPSKPKTIGDVAARAGVSMATVSRALRGLPNVAPETRERVHQAATELNYLPDPSAVGLATGRTRTVAMAVPYLDSWYFATVMASAEAVLAPAGYDLLVFGVPNPEMRRRALSGPVVNRADGLILVDVGLSDVESAELAALGVETVSVGTELEWSSTVTVDDRSIGASAAAHLAELGHSRIGLLTGRFDPERLFKVPPRRIAGFLDELAGRGLSIDSRHMVGGGFSIEGGHGAAAQLLAQSEPPTAVFALSDEIAFGALQALREQGLEAPGDVSIVGVDDHPFSAVVGLTTIQQEVGSHGTIAAQLLIDRLTDPGSEPGCHRAGTRLIVRESTARLSS